MRTANTPLYSASEGSRPAIMRQRRFEFGLPFRKRRRVVEVFDVLGAVGLNHHQLEAHTAGRGTSFAPDKSALPFVEPHHAAFETVVRVALSLA